MVVFASTEVAPDAGAPGAARAWCRAQLGDALPGGAGLDAGLVSDVGVVLSELVTNAVRAGCGRLAVQLFVDEQRVRVVVIDDVGGVPRQRQAGVDAVRGRGLQIVAGLSSGWGVLPVATGKQVWAELRLGGVG